MQITVSAQARASLPPERATVHMDLAFEGGDKQQVLSQTTILAQEFSREVDRLKTLSPSPTTWSAVLPIATRSWRPWAQDGATLPLRHGARCPVKLKFRDFAALASFVDRWGGREGVTIHYVEWTLTEERRASETDRVLAEAVRNATQRATVMARAAGAGDVEVLEIADPGFLQRPHGVGEFDGVAVRSAMGGAPDAGQGVDLQPEDVEMVAVVDARFTTR